MYKKILVPLDGSALAESALPHVRALAAQTQAEIVLLRVPVEPVLDYLAIDPLLYAPLHEAVEAEAREYLEKVAAPLRQNGLNVTTKAQCGLVANTILDCANSVHADLIVMSTHGHSGVARWLLGSVADKVVRGAKVPVLLTRPQPHPTLRELIEKAEREKVAAV